VQTLADYLVSLADRIHEGEPFTDEERRFHVHELRNHAMVCLNQACGAGTGLAEETKKPRKRRIQSQL
jgi:hypothetical protein